METRAIAILLVAATIAGGASVTGTAAQSGEGSVHFSGTGTFDRTVGVGETLTLEAVLNDVDTVGAFEYEFAVEDPSALRIEAVEPGPGVSEFDATIDPDGTRVALRGTGAEVRSSGYVDQHALVTVRGVANGTTDLTAPVADVQADNESAGELETNAQQVTVTERPIADVEMRRGVDASGSLKIPVEPEGEGIVAAEHADRGVGGFAVNLSTYYEYDRHVRFVDVTVQGDPDEESVRFGPNGTYVEVDARGLDGDATGTVYLLNVTMRGLERDSVLLDTEVEDVRTTDGTPYAIDGILLGTANVTAVSERGTPTFTAPPPEGANGTAVPSEATDGGAPQATATTDAAGPGFVALAALLAVAIAPSLSLLRRRTHGP